MSLYNEDSFQNSMLFLIAASKIQNNGIWGWRQKIQLVLFYFYYIAVFLSSLSAVLSQISVPCQFSSECFFLTPYFHCQHPNPNIHCLPAGLLLSSPPGLLLSPPPGSPPAAAVLVALLTLFHCLSKEHTWATYGRA